MYNSISRELLKNKLNIRTTHVKPWTHLIYTHDVPELSVEMDDMNLSQQQYKHAFSFIFLLHCSYRMWSNAKPRQIKTISLSHPAHILLLCNSLSDRVKRCISSICQYILFLAKSSDTK